MDPSLMLPLGLTVGLGAFASHILSNRRINRLKRDFIRSHMVAMTAVADAACEMLCVDHGMDVEEAQKALMSKVHERIPTIMAITPPSANPQFLAKARQHVEAMRAAKKAKTDGEQK
jgi:fumarate reductase subunit D